MSSALRKQVNDLSSNALEDRRSLAPQGRLLSSCGSEQERGSNQCVESSHKDEAATFSRFQSLRLVAKVVCCLILGLLVGSHLPGDDSGEEMIDVPEEGLDIQALARQLRLPAATFRDSMVRKGSGAKDSATVELPAQGNRRARSGSIYSKRGEVHHKIYANASEHLPELSMPVEEVIEQIIKKHGRRTVPSKQLARTIVEVSASLGYDPIFVAAVIKSESAFNTHARSHKGARGLMQLMPATSSWLVKTNGISKGELSEPRHNLRLGITYLKQLEAQYSGNRLFALVAYNWGPGHVQSATGGKRRVPKECMKYALTILRDYGNWSKGFI